MAPKIRKGSGGTSGTPSLEELEAELERRRSPAASALSEARRQAPPNELRLRYSGVGKRLKAKVVRDDLRFGFPFLSWDAWMVLLHISREPLEHNRDGSIPARWIKPLERRLVPLPSWVGIEDSIGRRVPHALNLLLDLKLLSSRRGPMPEVPNLGISPGGSEVVKAGRPAFFERCMDCEELRSFDPARDLLGAANQGSIDVVCWRMGHEPDEFEGLGRRLAQRVLEVLPPVGAVRMSDMERAFAPSHPHDFVRGVPMIERRIEVSSEDFFDRIQESSARALMVGALIHPYFLGLVARGITAEGAITWSLTESGRNWLGLPSDPHPAAPRHAKVTPAFDLYFGRVDPNLLAEFSLFSDLTSQDHGIVGRLTRSSVQAASTLGLSAAEILASLDGHVASPLPDNVRLTLADWSRGAQPVRVLEGLVLVCPDESSASTLERLAKGSAERLSEAILLLPDRSTLAALRRKAAESGILL
ncbi:MAG TPA: helicase-associated domain-containing protein [Fibrobacteria bacterium]|nr:helicase-associated domain-containing protein [Fibrobacteria bacterium]